MGLLSRLFGSRPREANSSDREGLHVYVRCDRCGEKIHIRANRRTDVTQEFDETGERAARMLHKEILGSKCQNLMYAHLTLDAGDRVVESKLERCTHISRDEYEAAQNAE